MSKDEISVPRELLASLRDCLALEIDERLRAFGEDYRPHVLKALRADLAAADALLAQPNTCTKDGEVEVLGYSVKGNRYAIRLTKAELLELYEGYTGDALIELVDRRHVTRLQAAQAPVVLPERKSSVEVFTTYGLGECSGWNAYDDEFKRLNPSIEP